jgi:hypothetical protein
MPLYRILLLLLLLTTTSPLMARGETRKKIYNLCNITHPGDEAIPWDCRKIGKGETAEKLFGDRWLDLLRFNRIDRRHLLPGVSIKLPRNPADIADFSPLPASYPEAAAEEKFILVDLSEQFLAAYEHGKRVFSFPIASGNRKNRTPVGDFRVSAFSRRHESSLYQVEKTSLPYPMHYGLRFFVNEAGVAFWLHGRDLPGFPASHGCVGLYDEEMQRKYYHFSRPAGLQDSRTLYGWAIGARKDSGRFTLLKNGPMVRIIGKSPL